MSDVQKLVTSESYQKLLAGSELPAEEERALLDLVTRVSPSALPGISQLLANQRREMRVRLQSVETTLAEARAELARLREPPLYPADVTRLLADRRLEVTVGGRRQIVATAPNVDCATLRPGHEVLLDAGQTVVVATGEPGSRTGIVVTVVQAEGDHIVLRGPGDEEIVGICPPELAAQLRAGDRVVYARDSRCVLARLPQSRASAFALAEVPTTTFADIGGLDTLIADIKRDLDVHLGVARGVNRYRLKPVKGITVFGPPGNGKTSLAKGIANYVAQGGAGRFLHVAPGALRGVLYGQTEGRIRSLFEDARGARVPVVIFLDELDSFGARGGGPGHDIDGRVMGTLLDQIDGLVSGGHVLCVGATNRLDLCEEALIRKGRLGDRIYEIPRPDREAARQIFARHLEREIPCEPLDDPGARDALIGAAATYLYTARGGAGVLATVTLANGDRREVTPSMVVSGALIESVVAQATAVAARRDPEGVGGVMLEDVLAALDDALAAEAEKLRAPHAARRLLSGLEIDEIVRVEVPRRRPPRHRFLRAA